MFSMTCIKVTSELHPSSQFFVASKLSPLCSWDTTYPWCIRETNQYNVYAHIHTRTFIKWEIERDWLVWLWRLTSPKSAGWAGRLETQRREDAVVQVQRSYAVEFFLAQGRSVFLFYSGLQLIGWGPPTHIMENNLLHSKSTTFNVYLI